MHATPLTEGQQFGLPDSNLVATPFKRFSSRAHFTVSDII